MTTGKKGQDTPQVLVAVWHRRCIRRCYSASGLYKNPKALPRSTRLHRIETLVICRALEPAISGQIMELHHSKHHNTYVTGLNKAAEAYSAVGPRSLPTHLQTCRPSSHGCGMQAEQKGDIQQMIATQQAIRFNGGGEA